MRNGHGKEDGELYTMDWWNWRGPSILELSKYPLRFQVSLVLLYFQLPLFSLTLTRSLSLPLSHLRTRMYSLLDCGLCLIPYMN